MDEEQKEKYWTDIKDDSYSDKDRTKDFVKHIQHFLKIDSTSGGIMLTAELKKLNPNLQQLIDYLEKHPDMLKYEFGQDGKISKIKVDPSRTFTFFKDSIKRQCNMSYGISKMLKILTSNSESSNDWKSGGNVEVEMSNEDYCKDKGITSMPAPGTLPRLDVLASNIPVSAGGRKSRRKPARKTRCGRNRKAKSKTHRRRRHSRVRKHKKNTYTRRR
jgi:hypothetical protein